MAEKSSTGSIFGIPYNFEKPSMKRLVGSYWQPGKGMLIEKPFGVGFSLNMANWRSWLVVGVAALLVWQERKGAREQPETEEGAVEVVVDE